MTRIRDLQTKVPPKDMPEILRQIGTLLWEHRSDFDPAYTKKKIAIELEQIAKYRTAVIAVDRKGSLMGFVRYGHTDFRAETIIGLRPSGSRGQQKALRQIQQSIGRSGRHGYIFSALVAKGARGKGVARKLMSTAIARTSQMRLGNGKNIGEIVLTCHGENTAMQQIAESLGLKLIGEVKAPGRKQHSTTRIYGNMIRALPWMKPTSRPKRKMPPPKRQAKAKPVRRGTGAKTARRRR